MVQFRDREQSNGHAGGTHTEVSRQISLESQISTGSVSSPTYWQRMTSWRYRVAFLMQLGVAVTVILKLNMPVALVCMIQQAPTLANTSLTGNMTSSFNFSSNAGEGFSREGNNSSVLEVRGEFQWDSYIQGLVLTSQGFLAYLTPPFSHFFTKLIGGKTLLQVSMLASGAFSLLMPFGARMSPYFLIALRCLTGIFTGFLLPVISELLAWWAPGHEKINMVSFAYMGINVGNILAGFTSGYLCSVPYDYGWPFIFYVHGAMTLAWCAVWQFFGTVRPEDHPFISTREKLFIIKTRIGMEGHESKDKVPLKTIFTSRPVWGYLLTMTSHYFSSMLIFSYLPIYLSNRFGLNVEEVGLFSSLGYIARLIGLILWGIVSNLMSGRLRLTTTVTRKTVQVSGYLATAGMLVVLGFVEDTIPALVILMLVMAFQSCTLVSAIVLPLDMAPRYASLISGSFLTIGSLVALPGPIIASVMTSEGTQEQWRNLFLVVAGVFSFGALCCVCLVNAELQTWAVPKGATAAEERARPLTPDIMSRRMTVFSAGPPVTPTPGGQSFDFTVGITAKGSDQSAIEEEGEEKAVSTRQSVITTTTATPATTINGHATIVTATPKTGSDAKSVSSSANHPFRSKAGFENPAFESTEQDGLSNDEGKISTPDMNNVAPERASCCTKSRDKSPLRHDEVKVKDQEVRIEAEEVKVEGQKVKGQENSNNAGDSGNNPAVSKGLRVSQSEPGFDKGNTSEESRASGKTVDGSGMKTNRVSLQEVARQKGLKLNLGLASSTDLEAGERKAKQSSDNDCKRAESPLEQTRL